MAERRSILHDWLPVVVVAPVLVIGAAVTGQLPITALGVVSAVVGSLPLAVRRRVPFPVFAVPLTAGIVLILWQLRPGDVVIVLPMVALFDIAQYGDRRRSLWLAAITVPCVAISVIPFAQGDVLAGVVFNLLLCLLAIAGGDILRSRQAIAERAAAIREEATLRRIGDERLEIAREIHDVVAHAMTAINVQAGVAAHLLERDPEHAHAALRDIKRTSGDALTDLRATLNLLRDPDQTASVEVPGTLRDLDGLTAGLSAAGVSVSLEAPPSGLADLPAPIQSAGYRIVQEALTNVTRHAQASLARVQVRREAGAVLIEVTDNGPGAAPVNGAGNGVRGMRERAEALGGTLEASPVTTGGWQVRARLPLSQNAPP